MIEKSNRIWEIDFIRGIALLLMIFFHIMYDLGDIYGYPVNYESGVIWVIGRVSAILFIIISGLSSTLSRNNPKRGLKVFAAALAISIVTYIAGRDYLIKFGILHFLGVSMMIYPLLNKAGSLELIVGGVLSLLAGNLISKVKVQSGLLFPVGLTNKYFYSADYYPVFPWIGVYIFGIVAGRFLYKERKSLFSFSMKDNPLLFLGRHTFMIYLIHQPLIIIILKVLIR